MDTLISFRRLWPIVILSMLLTTRSRAAAGDPPEYTYRAYTHEVQLTFSVTDKDHHAIATLQPGDLAVVDRDFIVRDFQSFTRSNTKKLDLGILIDRSGSVAPKFSEEIASLLDVIDRTSGIPEQNVSLFSFRDLKPILLCSSDCRSSRVAERLTIPGASDLTPLFDSIIFATDFMAKHGEQDAQKILIVISDGQDSYSRNCLRDAVESAMRNSILVYSIDMNRESASQGSSVLWNLATQTGGRSFSGAHATRAAVSLILQDYESSYTITYRVPSTRPGFHSLRILPTRNLNLEFRSRGGYYYPDTVR